MFDSVSFQDLFSVDTPLIEIFIRGSAVYLGIFLLLRVVLKRQSGSMGMGDMLLIVMIADAAQNGMADDYRSVTDGLALVATLVFWDWLLDALSYHVPLLGRLLEPQPLQLVRNGRIIQANMRREMMTRDELMSQLREHGVDQIGKVRRAYMEPDGKLSVVQY